MESSKQGIPSELTHKDNIGYIWQVVQSTNFLGKEHLC